jgi:DNA-binding NarL/FixJ family response regulator
MESGNLEEGRSLRLKILHRSRLFRESLGTVLAQRAGFAVETIDHTSPDWLAAIELPSPDVVLIDLKLPRRMAVNLVEFIHQRGIDAKVLLLVTSHDWQRLLDCIELGIHGCVLGDFSLEHLVESIERAVQGDMFCSPEILDALFRRLSRRRRKPRWLEKAANAPLTAREREVLELIAQGLVDREIAEQLSVSVSAVKNYVRSILNKIPTDTSGENCGKAQVPISGENPVQ